MKKNNKGFTLIEILAVVIILSILIALIVPAVSKYIRNGKIKYYKSLEDEIVVIARDYYTSNKSELPRGQLNSAGVPMYINQVSLSTLTEKGYITNEIVDADKNPCSGYVRVENKGNKEYKYIPCIVCANYKSEDNNPYCTLDEDNIGSASKILNCDVSSSDYTFGEWTNKDVNLTLTSTYSDGTTPTIGMYKDLKNDIVIRANNNIGTYKITDAYEKNTDGYDFATYDRSGNVGNCNISASIKIDKEKPKCEWSGPALSAIEDTGKTTTFTLTCKDNNGIVTTANELKELLKPTSGISVENVTRTGNEKQYVYTVTVKSSENKTSKTEQKVVVLPNNAVKDVADNGNDAKTSNVLNVKDGTVPVCVWSSPAASSIKDNNKTTTYDLTCTDNIGISTSADVVKEGLTASNLTVSSVTRSGSTKSYTYKVTVQTSANTTKTETGNVTLAADIVKDTSSNSSTSTKSGNVTITDGTAPECTWSSPASSSIKDTGATTTYTLTCTDNVGIDSTTATATKIKSKLTTSKLTISGDPEITSSATKKYVYKVTVQTSANTLKEETGNVTLAAILEDTTGNKNASTKSGNVTITDGTKPTVGTISKSCSGMSCTLTSTLTDKVGVKYYALTTENTAPTSGWKTITTATTSYSYSGTVSAADTYYLWAKDTTGNVSSYKSVTVSSSKDYYCSSGDTLSGTTCTKNTTVCTDTCSLVGSYSSPKEDKAVISSSKLYYYNYYSRSYCPSGYNWDEGSCANYSYYDPYVCYSQSTIGQCTYYRTETVEEYCTASSCGCAPKSCSGGTFKNPYRSGKKACATCVTTYTASYNTVLK